MATEIDRRRAEVTLVKQYLKQLLGTASHIKMVEGDIYVATLVEVLEWDVEHRPKVTRIWQEDEVIGLVEGDVYMVAYVSKTQTKFERPGNPQPAVRAIDD